MSKIPICMIIDDPGPFSNAGTTGHSGEICETPTAFYMKLGEWARRSGVKGKFSVVPICGGLAAIDGSLGEYPGHTREERLEWIEMIRVLYQPNWTITSEIITHLMPWDIVVEKPIYNNQRENEYFAELNMEEKTQYIQYALQKLKNAGIDAGGCTMCWSIPADMNADFGRATLEAISNVYGPKDTMIFNDTFASPKVVYKDNRGYCAVKVPPAVGDIDGSLYASGEPDEQRINEDANYLISEDGVSGAFVEVLRAGKPLIFLTHIQTLHTNGKESGFEVYKKAVDRLNRRYGDQIAWMTGEDMVNLVVDKQADSDYLREPDILNWEI